MHVVYDFKDLVDFRTRIEMDAFRVTLKNNTWGTGNNKPCTKCKNKPGAKAHRMKLRFEWQSSKLRNKNNECRPVKYRKITGLEDNHIYMSIYKEHSNDENAVNDQLLNRLLKK